MRCGLFLLALAISSALPGHAAEDPVAETQRRIRDLQRVVALHGESTGQWPQSATHLAILARMAEIPVPVQGGVPVDAWGRGFLYVSQPDPSLAHALYSAGPDGVDDAAGGDDVVFEPASEAEGDVRRARQLFPLALVCAAAPIVFAVIRGARRATLG